MRHVTVTLFVGIMLALCALPVGAQYSPVHRGSIALAGTAQFTHSRDIGNDADFSTLELAPRVGYFLLPGLALSANLRYRHDGVATGHATSWGVGPGLTYYVSGLSRHVYPFVSGRTLFTWSRFTGNTGVSSDVRQSTSWLVSTGALVLLARHVGLTGELFYQHDRVTVAPGAFNSFETYGLQWGFAIFVN